MRAEVASIVMKLWGADVTVLEMGVDYTKLRAAFCTEEDAQEAMRDLFAAGSEVAAEVTVNGINRRVQGIEFRNSYFADELTVDFWAVMRP